MIPYFVSILKYLVSIVRDGEFWHGIVAAALIAVVVSFFSWLREVMGGLRKRYHNFDIAGFWIGTCWLPSYGDSKYLEIWRYTRKGDEIKLLFFAYRPDNSKIDKWLGGGIFRGTKLSAYYYQLDEETYESGVIAMGLTSLCLKGVYAQFDPKLGDEPFHASTADYTQMRIKLRFISRLRMVFGAAPLQSYEEVKKIYDKVLARNQRNLK